KRLRDHRLASRNRELACAAARSTNRRRRPTLLQADLCDPEGIERWKCEPAVEVLGAAVGERVHTNHSADLEEMESARRADRIVELDMLQEAMLIPRAAAAADERSSHADLRGH